MFNKQIQDLLQVGTFQLKGHNSQENEQKILGLMI